MTGYVGMVVKQILGPGHLTEDALPTPKAFRGIPMPVGGVPPATPAGARTPTGSPASTIPQPK